MKHGHRCHTCVNKKKPEYLDLPCFYNKNQKGINKFTVLNT